MFSPLYGLACLQYLQIFVIIITADLIYICNNYNFKPEKAFENQWAENKSNVRNLNVGNAASVVYLLNEMTAQIKMRYISYLK